MHWLIVNGELVLYGSVGESFWDDQSFTARDVLEALVMMSGDIVVRLNSGGGLAMEGLAIYNTLNAYAGKITIVVDGAAVSAASLIAMAGDTVVMQPGSLMMIHDPSADLMGNADELEAAAEVLNRMADQFATIYAAKAGIDAAKAREIMKAETWYTAADAVTAGFADEVGAVAATVTAKAPALFDYRVYGRAPAMLTALATASASLFKPKAATAAQPQETSMTLEQLIAMLAARFGIAAADVTTMCNRAIAAGIELNGLVALLNPAAVTTMTLANSAIKAKATELLGVVPPAPAPTQLPLVTMSAADVRDILSRGVKAGLDSTSIDAIMAAHPSNKDAAMNAIIDKVAEINGTKTPAATAHVTEDARDKFVMGATKGLMMKVGLKDGERNEFTGMSLVELARESVMLGSGKSHRDVRQMDKMLMVGTAFTMAAGQLSTSDFANILQNVAHKSALKGFIEADETFQLWTSKGSASDFKPISRVDLGLFPALDLVSEGAEYKYAKLSDRGVTVVVATYGKLIAITRQAIINDDLGILGTLPVKMGRAAKRTIGNLVYAFLNAPPAWSDSVAFFNAAHGNVAGSLAAPSEATWQAAVVAMGKQKDADSNATALNIKPKTFLSSSYQFTAEQLLKSTGSLTDSKNAGVVNTVQGIVTPITDQRITASTWYMAADPNQYDTVEVTYLDGVEEPVVESQNGWTIDGTELKVRLDAGVNPLDYRGLYRGQ